MKIMTDESGNHCLECTCESLSKCQKNDPRVSVNIIEIIPHVNYITFDYIDD